MKKLPLSIYLSVFCLLMTTTVFSQLKHLTNVGKLPDHPRILLLKGEEKSIQKNFTTDKNWAKIHGVILSECDKLIATPTLERIQIGRRLLATSREALRRIFFLSYAWRTTHEEKYLKRAESELLAVTSFSDWNPSHFLDVGEMTMAVSIGYDWLYHDLQKSSLPILKEAILKKGIEPSFDSKYNSWLKVTNNWNQVCNAGMSYGALAIYEENPELAKQIIDRAIESIKLPMEDYKPDGAYPEGYGYWNYGTSFNVLFISAIQKVLGSDYGLSSAPGFLNTAAYLENMAGPSGKNFNYSDSGNGLSLSPAMFWFANRTKDYSLLYIEKSMLEKGENSMAGNRILPAAMLWGEGISLDKTKEPKQLFWTGQGKNPVAMMRSSWSDPNAIYVGLKGGSPSVSHGHMDIGSFVMDANGERWSMDFGMQDYETLESKGVKLWGREQDAERWRVYRYNNFAHSTLTFNNELQRVDGYAPISGKVNKLSFLGAMTDMTAVYKNVITSANRGIAIVDEKYVVVKDEITTTDKPTTVKWVMLTPAEVRITENGTAELTQKGKKLQLKVLEPANVTLKTWSTQPPNDYDAANPGTMLVGFEVALPANTNSTVNVLLIPEGITVNKDTKIPSLKDWKK
ncbi:heparinase II/III domain-containing protein [Runella sp.]|uniref:heparinase II/III domain-containing protein n=1 Tax=Runella sp. TaxID=1960881 RepID=UPI003D142648